MSGNRGKGRPKGSLNKRSLEAASAAQELGVNPLSILLHLAGAAHAEWMDALGALARVADADAAAELEAKAAAAGARAADYAAKAAPYLHPRLAASETRTTTLSHEEWMAALDDDDGDPERAEP